MLTYIDPSPWKARMFKRYFGEPTIKFLSWSYTKLHGQTVIISAKYIP